MRALVRRFTPLQSLVLVVALVAGCSSEPVADDLAQRDANAIIAVLQERGIAGWVSKARGARASYSVYVKSGNFAEAVAILNRLGLPPEKKSTFEEMTAANGIIPSSREVEALRLDRALAAQVEDLLKARSDVSSVSVVVQYHALDGRGKPSVSVIAQRREGSKLSNNEIRDIVAHSVVGVAKDDVFVSVADSASKGEVSGTAQAGGAKLVPFLGFWRVPVSEYNGLAVLVVSLVAFGAMLAGLFGYIVGQFNWIKRESGGGSRSSSVRAQAAREARSKEGDSGALE